MRDHDVIAVASMDRLARSVVDLDNLVSQLTATRGAVDSQLGAKVDESGCRPGSVPRRRLRRRGDGHPS
ncbi:MAG TPA: recombinase family protein, partial [Ornithinibacter sp.]|nr:recombinase family protein [Ornithinibacter sp.]